MRRKNVERVTLMMQKTQRLKYRHKMSDGQIPMSSIKEQSSRYQVSLLDSTDIDIGNFINKTADDFTKSLIVKRSNIPFYNKIILNINI